MSQAAILAFHGSPGLPEDYQPLSEALKKTLAAFELTAIIRAGYPGAQAILSPSSGVYLGYSFGCADCVETAAQDPKAKALILISPYLFPNKKPGLVTGLLLSLPLVSDAILSKAGPKAMRDFVKKSSYPAEAPEAYRLISQHYAKPEILKRAMTESKGRGPGIQKALATLAQRHIPVCLIWGKQDQTSLESEQIAPLRSLFKCLSELSLDQAGHALLWTHPDRLAEEIQSFIQGAQS